LQLEPPGGVANSHATVRSVKALVSTGPRAILAGRGGIVHFMVGATLRFFFQSLRRRVIDGHLMKNQVASSVFLG